MVYVRLLAKRNTNPNTPCCVPAGTVEDGGVGGVCSGGCGGVIRGESSGGDCCGVRWWGDVARVVAAEQWCGWSWWWSDCGDGCDGEAAVVRVAAVGVVAAAVGCGVEVGAASGGEWGMGSSISECGESFWVRRKKPAGKVFRRRWRGGRR
nr:hypothetical protein [Tanacetum cinerariifolium]